MSKIHRVMNENAVEDTLHNLKSIWELDKDKLNKGIFESKADSDVLIEPLKLSYFFQTHLRPQPWWGQIIDPKVIVLGLNPSYDPLNDENDEETIKDGLLENLGTCAFNWFDYGKKQKEDETSGYKFWNKTLGRFRELNDLLWCEPSKIYDNVGFFNLYGYHTSPFRKIQKRCFIDNAHPYLPTEIALAKHLKVIISEETYVIVIWGYEYWKQLKVFSGVTKDKLLVVNRNNGRNHVITEAWRLYKKCDEKTKAKDFSCNGVKNSDSEIDIENKYEEFYKKIKDVIMGT